MTILADDGQVMDATHCEGGDRFTPERDRQKTLFLLFLLFLFISIWLIRYGSSRGHKTDGTKSNSTGTRSEAKNREGRPWGGEMGKKGSQQRTSSAGRDNGKGKQI